MKLLLSPQIRQLDKATIQLEPISFIDLMERVGDALFSAILKYIYHFQPIAVFAGGGNNGGDALSVARKLKLKGYDVTVYLLHNQALSPDCEINKYLFLELCPEGLVEMVDAFEPPLLAEDALVVDGLLGTGTNRPLKGLYEQAVRWMNQQYQSIISIDLPSGLSAETFADMDINAAVRANYTITLQFPKLAFFYPEYASYVGEWECIDIGLHQATIDNTVSHIHYLERDDVAVLYRERNRFGHKGTYGHALIVAGNESMPGASVLTSKATLRSGAGLVSLHAPSANRTIVQSNIPELIFHADKQGEYVTEFPDLEIFSAVAIGPGLGTEEATTAMLRRFLESCKSPCVLDADALNIIAQQKDLLQLIPKNCILTPHPKEFDRMFGACSNSAERIAKAREMAQLYEIIVVLKGANSLIACPDGNVFFNSTGNPGMATAGSGDVLTGVLAGLLAQGYSSEDATKMGVFLHGRAGDLALENESVESLIASDIIAYLGRSFLSLQ